MSKPNKQESEHLRSLHRQLERLAISADSLYRRMTINGRDQKYSETAMKVSIRLENLAYQVGEVVKDLDQR